MKRIAIPSMRIPDAAVDSSTITNSFDKSTSTKESPAHRFTSELLDHQITNEVNNPYTPNTVSYSYDDNLSKFIAGQSVVKSDLGEYPSIRCVSIDNFWYASC